MVSICDRVRYVETDMMGVIKNRRCMMTKLKFAQK